MVLIIVGALAGAFLAIKEFRENSDRWAYWFLFAMLGGVVGFLVSFEVQLLAPTSCVSVEAQPIHSLSTDTSSRFYLGSNYINEQLTYFYFTQESDGAFVSHSVRAGLGRIYETENVAPNVTTYEEQVNPFFRPFILFDYGNGSGNICEVVFVVPHGSVVNNYHAG